MERSTGSAAAMLSLTGTMVNHERPDALPCKGRCRATRGTAATTAGQRALTSGDVRRVAVSPSTAAAGLASDRAPSANVRTEARRPRSPRRGASGRLGSRSPPPGSRGWGRVAPVVPRRRRGDGIAALTGRSPRSTPTNARPSGISETAGLRAMTPRHRVEEGVPHRGGRPPSSPRGAGVLGVVEGGDDLLDGLLDLGLVLAPGVHEAGVAEEHLEGLSGRLMAGEPVHGERLVVVDVDLLGELGDQDGLDVRRGSRRPRAGTAGARGRPPGSAWRS